MYIDDIFFNNNELTPEKNIRRYQTTLSAAKAMTTIIVVTICINYDIIQQHK